MNLSCEPELDIISKKFKVLDEASKLQMLRKLREIASPYSTTLEEPAKRMIGSRGKASLKVDTSTRRDPSAFELVLSGQDSYSPRTDTPMTQIQKRQPRKKVSRPRPRFIKTIYIDQIPDGLRPFIKHIKDVKADGNCGFRAIADLLGFGEDDWLRVRKDLLHELQCHSEHYRVLFNVEGRFDEIAHALSYFENCPPTDRWMTMPDMGHLIASCYNVVLYHLSLQQCLTFLPLRSVPLPPVSRKDIAVAFVNGNHFVEVLMLPSHPVPPIATNWRRYHLPCASGWANSYESRIQQFKQTISSDVIISETVEL